jgi:hypothetical protein
LKLYPDIIVRNQDVVKGGKAVAFQILLTPNRQVQKEQLTEMDIRKVIVIDSDDKELKAYVTSNLSNRAEVVMLSGEYK